MYISRKGNDLVRTWQCKSNIFSGNCQVSLYIADYTYDDFLQVGQFVRIKNSIISLPWKILLLYLISSSHSYDDNYLPNSILKFKKNKRCSLESLFGRYKDNFFTNTSFIFLKAPLTNKNNN